MSTVTIKAYQSNNNPGLYVLNYRSLVGYPLYFEITNPYADAAVSWLIKEYKVLSYQLMIGDYVFKTSTNNITATIDTPGTYNLKLIVTFNNNTTKTYTYNDPIVIYNEWPVYDYENIYVLDNTDVVLPYTIEDIRIKPNEFGVADVLNASIKKLNDCILFLKKRSTVMYNKTPTQYIGWLGIHKDYIASDAVWHTTSDSKDLSRDFNSAITESGNSTFNGITDIKIIGNELYIADKTPNGTPCITFGYLTKTFSRIIFSSQIPFLSQLEDISAIEIYAASPSIRYLFILDKLTNKLYKATIGLDSRGTFLLEHLVGGYLEQSLGGFGDKEASSKFYSPNSLHYKDEHLYVTDTNNFCVKKFSINLGWIKTYYHAEFLTDIPICTVVNTVKSNVDHPSLIYILTATSRLYILNQDGSFFDEEYPYFQLDKSDTPKKIILDTAEEFFYVIYNSKVIKYSILGMFVNVVGNIDSIYGFTAGCIDANHNIYIADKNRVFKFLDVVESFSIFNSALDNLYWKEDDLKVAEEEFLQDWSVNRVLNRVTHNANTFRKSLHSKFGIINTYSVNGVTTEYTAIPIPSADTLPCTENALKDVTVGVNELTLSQVLNRGLEKIYNCIDSLREILNANYLTQEEGGANCNDAFCWSWKNTSCINLKLPSKQICNINPITYAELQSTNIYTYAPSITWREATSSCCK